MYKQFVFSKGRRQWMLILLQQAMGQQWSTTVQLPQLKRTKWYLVTCGSTKMKDSSKTRLFSFEAIFYSRLSCQLKITTHLKGLIAHVTCCSLLCCIAGLSLSIYFLLIILIFVKSLLTVRIMTVSVLTTELIPCVKAMWINSGFEFWFKNDKINYLRLFPHCWY